MFKHRIEKTRDITPNRLDKNGSFYLNFKLFDSTIINTTSKLNDTRKSYEEAPLTQGSIKLPNIGQTSKIDSRIDAYVSNYNETSHHDSRVIHQLVNV